MPALASGERLGPYEIVEPAGAGGMGDVYRAKDTRLNRDVAVKTDEGRVHRAVRARGEGDLVAEPPEHLHALRRRPARRQRLPRDGVHRGQADRRADASRSGHPDGHPDLRCALRRAQEGHRPSRPEARQHPGDQAGHQAARLRAREADRRRARVRCLRASLDDARRSADRRGADRRAHRGRHAAVHGARADQRRGSGRPHRHLRVRVRALRADHGPARLRRQERVEHHGLGACDDAEADRGTGAADAARTGPGHLAVPREGSGGSLAVGSRRRGRAEVDRGGRIESRSARGRDGEAQDA